MKMTTRLTTGIAAAVALSLVCGSSARAALIDDFSDTDLSQYTSTVILDAGGTGSNTATWSSPSGSLQLDTTAYDGIEQYAMIYNGLSLGVGQEVQVDLTHSGASQDLGLYVGGTTPVVNMRQDYVSVYARGDGSIYSRGFDGTSEYGLAGVGVQPYDSLFIARTAANTYEAGYYNGAVRNIVTTRTPTTPNDGDVVGFYADVRALGTLGNLDNLRIVPEPASLALAGLALAGLAVVRRRK
ncbi:MAG: PEP-CTERM sorting domain-containing protein [Planctomycetales bacterium]|nr:PEP-CTERM sorting domain-containing protein [Planctomycetales bacterium]